MTLDAAVLPSELVTMAQPLVGLSGLDVQRNTIHKTIWDAFNNSKKPESESIQYKLLPASYEFPVSKPKHQSYEWYHPKGILKRNWMLKHLHVLPAVVVLFQDLDWNDPQWSDRQLQCASMISTLKNSLQGRNTRLAVVLLQKGSPSSVPAVPGEDMLASERAAHLTSTCDINAKMLFVLPHNDHLMGHILRLQSAFLELAQSYYTQMMKQIRLHRDQLTDSHQMLKIRHQFKLGFVSELKLDQSSALRHYRQTYANLDEIRIVDTNCLEVKTIAGFVNYKICRLFFKLNAPKDSISHFKNHISKYRNRTGFKELLFEHYAWLSVQYSAFGELFCDAVKNGLAPLQTQHPGIYFHKAAEFIGKRKEAFLQCTALGPADGGKEVAPCSNSALYSDFFGIRGTKTGEPVSEQQIICLVQDNEKSYNHSTAIITLLGQAMAQYKVYKCLRFRKKLAIDMAEEYLKSGDHSKALTLYSLMLSDYRVDKWFTIFTEVLLKTLRSAYLSASVPDFVACSIEALSPRIAMEKPDRILILENLWKVFHNVSPVSSSQIAPELSASWQTSLAAFASPIKLDLDRLNDLLECKITFEQRQIKNDEKLHLQLYIRSIVEVPLKLKNFSILLSDLKSNSVRVPATQYGEFEDPATLKPMEEFILEPQKCYRIVFVGERYQFMENVDVHIFRLELQMGSDRTYAVLSAREKLNVQRVFKPLNPHQDCMERIRTVGATSCYIIPTFALSAQTKQSAQPMLTNEFYRVTTKISNNSDLCLQNVGVSVSVPQTLRNSVFLTTDLDDGGTSPLQKINSCVQIDIGELQMQSQTAISYYVTSLVEGNIELRQRVYYQTENLHQLKTTASAVDSPSTPNSEKEDLAKLLANEQQRNAGGISQKFSNSHNVKIEYLNDELVRKIKEDTVVVPCVEEVKLSGRFYTLSRQPLTRAYKNEDFILRVNMEVKAPDGVDILETQFISDTLLVFYTLGGGPTVIDPMKGETRWTIADELAIRVPSLSDMHPHYLPDPRGGSLYTNRNPRSKDSRSSLTRSAPCRSSDGILYPGKKRSDDRFLIDLKTSRREKVLGFGTPLDGDKTESIRWATWRAVMMYDSQATGRNSKPWNVTYFDYTSHVTDHNLVEKPYRGQQRISGTRLRVNSRFEDLRLLNPVNTSREWVSQNDYLNNDVQLTFSRGRTPDLQGSSSTARQPQDEQQPFNRSLLAKLPTNATIIGSTNANLTNQLNLPLTSNSPQQNAAAGSPSPVPPVANSAGMMVSSTGSAEDFKVRPLPAGTAASASAGDAQKDDFSKALQMQVKNVYNRAIDCVQLTNNERNGFVNATISSSSGSGRGRSVEPGGGGNEGGGERTVVFGVYCVRWCRSSTPNIVNESKFVINGIDVIDPPLNIYCYLDEKMYVRVPMTLRVTLKNPTRKNLHLQALLNSSDSFMFSGHRQLSVTIFAFSSYDLLFNLYPLKAGWQPLPELQLEYVNHHHQQLASAGAATTATPAKDGKSTPAPSETSDQADATGSESLEAQLKAELDALVKRWMPKAVFIHPPTRN